jgi:hypothetical protein
VARELDPQVAHPACVQGWDQALHEFRIVLEAMAFDKEHNVVRLELLDDVLDRVLPMAAGILDQSVQCLLRGPSRSGLAESHPGGTAYHTEHQRQPHGSFHGNSPGAQGIVPDRRRLSWRIERTPGVAVHALR